MDFCNDGMLKPYIFIYLSFPHHCDCKHTDFLPHKETVMEIAEGFLIN